MSEEPCHFNKASAWIVPGRARLVPRASSCGAGGSRPRSSRAPRGRAVRLPPPAPLATRAIRVEEGAALGPVAHGIALGSGGSGARRPNT